MVCPLCGTKLEIKQINLETAIIICPDLKCPYPLGSECIAIARKLDNIDKERDIVILPETNLEIKTETIPNDTNNKQQNEVFSVLENEIDRLSQSSQTDYNDEFNIMEIISDNFDNFNTESKNNDISGGNVIESNQGVTDFDVNEFLKFL